MIYGCSPAAVKIPSCTDSSSVNGIAGTYFATGSNLSGDDEFSDDHFETNQHNKSENDDNFSILITSLLQARETGHSDVNKTNRKSGNIIPKLIGKSPLSASQKDSILLPEAIKAAATDMRYFARSEFSRSLVHKKKFS